MEELSTTIHASAPSTTPITSPQPTKRHEPRLRSASPIRRKRYTPTYTHTGVNQTAKHIGGGRNSEKAQFLQSQRPRTLLLQRHWILTLQKLLWQNTAPELGSSAAAAAPPRVISNPPRSLTIECVLLL